ncbi:MAG: alkaline phosphatase [Bacteroidales bacterium]|nr:alkaline phosphatase [Bacteroidales bacterium]
MRKLKRLLVLLFMSATMVVAQTSQPKNIIFMVGDGMGVAQVYTSIVAMKGQSNFERFKHVGFSKTYSYSDYTTDSGAGGTALFTGHKVNNKAIAMSPDGKPLTTLLEKAQEYGMKTGFVVSTIVNCATPSATYAHVSNRNHFDSITYQLSVSDIDFFSGGFSQYFNKTNRKDGLSPIDTLIKRGFDIVYTIEDMEKSEAPRIGALLTDGYPAKYPERGDILGRGVAKAIEHLNNTDEGFVLMVEGSQIDYGGHDTSISKLTAEVVEFDKVIGMVLDFAIKDGETLVIVTADHETGGLTLPNGNINSGLSEAIFTTTNHTGVMVPIFAYGPGAENFAGIMQNTDIYDKIVQIMKWVK